ncbi:Phosphomethylpyrimidine kinase-domain-containing protein [Cyathus striatus]|nr:Phosphomethylpyrimidine kinase-domain-containing protein [Cyathus striatus]
MEDTRPLVVLTIAGTDPSGGAGIQADLKTIAALRCYGCSAITAMTAQNTSGFVEKQIQMVLMDMPVSAIKTGMLYDATNALAVVKALKSYYHSDSTPMPPLVCDPVSVSTSGHTLLRVDAIQTLIKELFPLATLITPNKAEAELLLSQCSLEPTCISSVEDMLLGAKALLGCGCKAVLLKGGHIAATTDDINRVQNAHPGLKVVKYGLLEDNMEIFQTGEKERITSDLVVDVLQQKERKPILFIRPRIESRSTHGTGCTLSSAITSMLAKGADIEEATKDGTAYTHLGIETAYGLGKGYGPLNHSHSLEFSSIPQRTGSNPYPFTRLLIQCNKSIWKEYVEHDFVKLLGKGTLPMSAFTYFIKQDYHYLKYYCRAYGLLAAKSSSFTAIGSATQTINNVITEIKTHKGFCLSLGISEEELENTPEGTATTAYGAYLLDVGLEGDSTKLLVALLACLLGYGEVGLWLKRQAAEKDSWVKIDGNPYVQWMEDYGGRVYQEAVRNGLEVIEACAEADPPSPRRLEEWRKVWERCTRLEKGFWDAAMRHGRGHHGEGHHHTEGHLGGSHGHHHGSSDHGH